MKATQSSLLPEDYDYTKELHIVIPCDKTMREAQWLSELTRTCLLSERVEDLAELRNIHTYIQLRRFYLPLTPPPAHTHHGRFKFTALRSPHCLLMPCLLPNTNDSIPLVLKYAYQTTF